MIDSAVLAYGIFAGISRSSLFFSYDQILIQLLIEGVVVWLITLRSAPFLKTLYWVIVANALCFILAGLSLLTYRGIPDFMPSDIGMVIFMNWLIESVLLIWFLRAASWLRILIAVLLANLVSYGAGYAILTLYYKYNLFIYRLY